MKQAYLHKILENPTIISKDYCVLNNYNKKKSKISSLTQEY